MRVWVLAGTLFVAVTWFLTACAPTRGDEPLTVGAAASMRFVLEEAGPLYTAETGQKVVFVYGSTGDLARQIEAGAPLDLFMAADRETVERLEAAGLLQESTSHVYAVGRIVLAVHRRFGPAPEALADLLAGRWHPLAIANPSHAPYGRAAREALTAAGVWPELEKRVVYGENVGQVLQFIQTGNAAAGIIPLALAEVPEITYTLIDQSLHSPLGQSLGVVAASPRREAAAAFARFLAGETGRGILERYGFAVPER